jgi:hypothetical protein
VVPPCIPVDRGLRNVGRSVRAFDSSRWQVICCGCRKTLRIRLSTLGILRLHEMQRRDSRDPFASEGGDPSPIREQRGCPNAPGKSLPLPRMKRAFLSIPWDAKYQSGNLEAFLALVRSLTASFRCASMSSRAVLSSPWRIALSRFRCSWTSRLWTG